MVGKVVSKIVVNFDGLRRTRWHEYGIRFLAGGTITALVGIIGRKFGPSIGGLFLAFPAIFPASAMLVEKHELEKKRNAGVNGVLRSRGLWFGGFVGGSRRTPRCVPVRLR